MVEAGVIEDPFVKMPKEEEAADEGKWIVQTASATGGAEEEEVDVNDVLDDTLVNWTQADNAAALSSGVLALVTSHEEEKGLGAGGMTVIVSMEDSIMLQMFLKLNCRG